MRKKTIVDGLEISYIEEGEGSPVLLLHGWGCNGGHWNAVIEGLEADHRVVAPDIPGFGESEEPPETWTTADFADFFEHFLAAIEMQDPVIIGHSNGGRISMMLASRSLARKVILTDSAGIKPHHSASYYAKVYSYKAMKKALSLPLLRDKKEAILDKYRGKTGSADYNAASPGMRRIMSTVLGEDFIPVLKQIKVPTLLVWGSEDTATPLSDGETMESVLKENGVDTALIVFEGRSHFAYLEECPRFISICKAFI